jgi:hypothetical protein
LVANFVTLPREVSGTESAGINRHIVGDANQIGDDNQDATIQEGVTGVTVRDEVLTYVPQEIPMGFLFLGHTGINIIAKRKVNVWKFCEVSGTLRNNHRRKCGAPSQIW